MLNITHPQAPEVMWPEVPGILHPVLDCLELFRLVVEGCFSWELVADLQEKMHAFTSLRFV